MKTFFSILSAPIRPESGEQISLGLILSDGNKSLFNFSVTKLAVIKSLTEDSSYHFIKRYLKAIENVINKVDTDDPTLIPRIHDQKNIVVNEPYIEYLSIYNRNVLSFSKPAKIDVEVTPEKFNQLFEKFIDIIRIPTIKNTIKGSISQVKRSFMPSVSNYFAENRKITPNEFPSVIIPVTIDLFGKNENIVFAQFIDMERNFNHIKIDYYDLKELRGIIPDAHSFLITAEPEKSTFQKQHEIWEHIRAGSDFDYVDISEVDRIKQYAVQHGVKPM